MIITECCKMEKEFVPYELAVKLKGLGFDEECLASFIKLTNGDMYLLVGETNSRVIDELNNQFKTNKFEVLAPLWQQAFDWFREKKDLLNHLTTHLNSWGEDGALETYYGYRIMIDKDGWKCDVWEELSRYENYEQARHACLEKLIELAEN